MVELKRTLSLIPLAYWDERGKKYIMKSDIFQLLTEVDLKLLIGPEAKPEWVTTECEGCYFKGVLWLLEEDAYVAGHEIIHFLVDKEFLPKAQVKTRKGIRTWTWLGVSIPSYFIDELSQFPLPGENVIEYLKDEIPAFIGEQLHSLICQALIDFKEGHSAKDIQQRIASRVEVIKDSL